MTTYSPASARDHYLTLREAVELGYGAYSTLRSWIAQGRLPAVKTGGRVKILRADLDALARPIGPDPAPNDDLDAAIERLVAQAPALSPARFASCSRSSAVWPHERTRKPPHPGG